MQFKFHQLFKFLSISFVFIPCILFCPKIPKDKIDCPLKDLCDTNQKGKKYIIRHVKNIHIPEIKCLLCKNNNIFRCNEMTKAHFQRKHPNDTLSKSNTKVDADRKETQEKLIEYINNDGTLFTFNQAVITQLKKITSTEKKQDIMLSIINELLKNHNFSLDCKQISVQKIRCPFSNIGCGRSFDNFNTKDKHLIESHLKKYVQTKICACGEIITEPLISNHKKKCFLDNSKISPYEQGEKKYQALLKYTLGNSAAFEVTDEEKELLDKKKSSNKNTYDVLEKIINKNLFKEKDCNQLIIQENVEYDVITNEDLENLSKILGDEIQFNENNTNTLLNFE